MLKTCAQILSYLVGLFTYIRPGCFNGPGTTILLPEQDMSSTID